MKSIALLTFVATTILSSMALAEGTHVLSVDSQVVFQKTCDLSDFNTNNVTDIDLTADDFSNNITEQFDGEVYVRVNMESGFVGCDSVHDIHLNIDSGFSLINSVENYKIKVVSNFSDNQGELSHARITKSDIPASGYSPGSFISFKTFIRPLDGDWRNLPDSYSFTVPVVITIE